MQEPFWMVYGMGQGGSTARHSTHAMARSEAERLARSNPNVEFFVLVTVGKARRVDVDYQAIDPAKIPF